MAISESELEHLIRLVDDERDGWVNGRPPESVGRFAQDDDMTIVGPFGGSGIRGREEFERRQPQLVQQFTSGTGSFEVIKAFAEGDVAVVIGIERSTVVFADTSAPRLWDLRSTQVFRKREDGSWVRLHRHADPLVDMRSLEETRDLLR